MNNGSEPATKGDLTLLKSELKGDMALLKSELKGDMTALREELVQAMHDMETNLLRAFYSYTEATQKHFSDLDKSDSSLRDRMGTLETRLLEVEKRLNFPPSSPAKQ